MVRVVPDLTLRRIQLRRSSSERLPSYSKMRPSAVFRRIVGVYSTCTHMRAPVLQHQRTRVRKGWAVIEAAETLAYSSRLAVCTSLQSKDQVRSMCMRTEPAQHDKWRSGANVGPGHVHYHESALSS